MDDLITADEAAKLLHLNVKRIQFLARSGALPAVRFGRKWLFQRTALVPSRPGATSARPTVSTALEISARNRLRGTITGITADGVMAEVRLRIADQEIVSIITSSSARRLGLAVGDEVFAVVKSTEVMIAKEA